MVNESVKTKEISMAIDQEIWSEIGREVNENAKVIATVTETEIDRLMETMLVPKILPLMM